MSEQQTVSEVDQLRSRLREQEAEILRLRDLLVGKDVELGVAKGRVVEYEDREKRLANAKKRLEAKIPFAGRLLEPILRLLRGMP
jgi:hypothetical protein